MLTLMDNKRVDQLFNMIEAQADPVERGIMALRQGMFSQAIQLLSHVVDLDSSNWRARLHLGLSYKDSNQLLLAKQQFEYLKDNCPENGTKQTATALLSAITPYI
jgi:hypothetical protein